MSLAAFLVDWTDMDVAAHDLARALGILPERSTMSDAKWVYWSNNLLGNKLVDLLDSLTAVGFLEKRNEPDFQYRIAPEFRSRLDVEKVWQHFATTGGRASEDPGHSLVPVPPELCPTVLLAPPNGWLAFPSSAALTELLSKSLGCWHYLNFTSDTSTWECPRHGTLAWLAFANGATISEFGVRLPSRPEHSDCALHLILDQLRAVYGLQTSL